ncbi:MAG: hypothetical protein H6828_15275, partial [Planctomycetes bacterium]|nr:hypothetical protein [Planctomycetota bacterium]
FVALECADAAWCVDELAGQPRGARLTGEAEALLVQRAGLVVSLALPPGHEGRAWAIGLVPARQGLSDPEVRVTHLAAAEGGSARLAPAPGAWYVFLFLEGALPTLVATPAGVGSTHPLPLIVRAGAVQTYRWTVDALQTSGYDVHWLGPVPEAGALRLVTEALAGEDGADVFDWTLAADAEQFALLVPALREGSTPLDPALRWSAPGSDLRGTGQLRRSRHALTLTTKQRRRLVLKGEYAGLRFAWLQRTLAPLASAGAPRTALREFAPGEEVSFEVEAPSSGGVAWDCDVGELGLAYGLGAEAADADDAADEVLDAGLHVRPVTVVRDAAAALDLQLRMTRHTGPSAAVSATWARTRLVPGAERAWALLAEDTASSLDRPLQVQLEVVAARPTEGLCVAGSGPVELVRDADGLRLDLALRSWTVHAVDERGVPVPRALLRLRDPSSPSRELLRCDERGACVVHLLASAVAPP